MSYARIVLSTPLDATQLAGELNLKGVAVDGAADLESLGKFIQRSKATGLSVRFVKNALRSAQQGTLTGDPTAGDTLTINGVAFTARASGAVANEFNISAGNVTVTMDNLVAAINASVSDKVMNIIKASNVAGVLTLTCLVPGSIGNLCTVTESMDNFTLVGTTLTGGDEDAQTVIENGQAA
jgi:hypothetical protein